MQTLYETNQQIEPQLLAHQIFNIVMKVGNFDHNAFGPGEYETIPLFKNILRLVYQSQTLTFILPAFPAKSSSPNKTSGIYVDLGEVLALNRLDKMAAEISKIYDFGIEIIICSDGRVFNDLVYVSDEALLQYQKGIEDIINQFNLHFIKTYNLSDYFSNKFSSIKKMRQELEHNFAPSIDSLREAIKKDPLANSMFCGIHRFIKEDMKDLELELSKNQIAKRSKKIAYQVIKRSRAWDQLLATKFKDTLRLSIHPYPITHHKFGVKLINSQGRWATPWHNVVLKTHNGLELVKMERARELGAQKKTYRGKYVFFEA